MRSTSTLKALFCTKLAVIVVRITAVVAAVRQLIRSQELEFQLVFQEKNPNFPQFMCYGNCIRKVLKTMLSIKQSQTKTEGQLVAVMPVIEKDLHGRKHYG